MKSRKRIDRSPVSNSRLPEARRRPTPPGRTRRPDRGLPTEEARRELARTYLETQRRLWPELAQDGTLPPPDEDVLARMAEAFRLQFLDEDIAPYEPLGTKMAWEALAASYLRYSCDNSNPRSLDQQLVLQLERAARDRRFIPWSYVFADAAVSGTTADRSGYRLAKQALALTGVKALYIDEIGRASRDAIEALGLGRLVERHRNRLIGVSDGFDSASPTSKITLSLFAMLQEWFIDQLRSKVNRGMDDAFDRGTNITPPPVGYRLRPAVDAHGRPLFGADGEQLNMKVIDEAEAVQVLEAFRLFAEDGKSPESIARLLNQRRFGDRQTWCDSSVRQLLRRRTYAGIEIYRQTRHSHDPETGKVMVSERPRKEWRVRRAPHLRIVPWPLWKTTQRRLDACTAAYAPSRKPGEPTRTELYPTVLIRPSCGSCGANLILGRSGKYASFHCDNGKTGRNGCTARGYKTVRIVEDAVLGHLRQMVFTPEFLGRVVEAANGFLAEEARRPREDTTTLETEIRRENAALGRLSKILDRDGAEDLDLFAEKVRKYERRLKELRGRLAELRARNEPPPPPLTLADAQGLLEDLQGLLEQDVATAAPLLAELTGPVVVHQVAEPGKARPTWFARFTVNAVPVLAKLAASRRCPTTPTWEYLNKGGWTMREEVETRLAAATVPQRFAAEVAAMVDRGASLSTAAEALRISRATARAALDCADAAEGPGGPASPGWRPGEGAEPLYRRIADEVARRRDVEHQSFKSIAAALEVSPATVTRAYDWTHRDDLLAAAEQGRRRNRGYMPILGVAKHREIARHLQAGCSLDEVAAEVGCGRSTVYRVRRSLSS